MSSGCLKVFSLTYLPLRRRNILAAQNVIELRVFNLRGIAELREELGQGEGRLFIT